MQQSSRAIIVLGQQSSYLLQEAAVRDKLHQSDNLKEEKRKEQKYDASQFVSEGKDIGIRPSCQDALRFSMGRCDWMVTNCQLIAGIISREIMTIYLITFPWILLEL